MPNRRQFLKTMAATTAGACLTSRITAQTPARRQISIGGRRVKVIDVHNHWDMPLPMELVKGTPFEEHAKGPGLDDRSAVLDRLGIDVAAVSVNDFWWYDAKDRGLARAICGYHNETLATWNRQHPDRLVGMASVPLQFPDLAAEMLQEAVTRFGARGVTVGGHVAGESLSLARFDPFWAKAAEMRELVFMHPNGSANLLKEGALAGRGGLGNIVGNPLETTVFLSRLMFDGTFDKFPALRVCGAHGGGYLPSYLGRTDVACGRPNQNCIIKRKPADYLREQILADSMVFTGDGLRHLVAELGAGQVVYGTDTPFGWPAPVDYILNTPSLSNAEKEQILGGNLMKLLRIAS
ncbi:MAG: amidohydrolase family protein [Acidobacteria bacterium]|nr:amidohydrolase family protein [Acidobacteriota bacterium]